MIRNGKIFVASLFFVLIGFVMAFSFAAYAQDVEQNSSDSSGFPVANHEVNEYVNGKYKFAENGDFVLFAEKELSCEWKSDEVNDGYKTCVAEVGMWNRGDRAVSFSMRPENFVFDSDVDVRDGIDVRFSEDFNLVEEEGLPSHTLSDEWRDTNGEQVNVLPEERIGVRIIFEMPQYEGGHYNFIYSPLGFVLDPPVTKCGTLSTPGGNYTQTLNITTNASNCIVVVADGINYDGNGNWIQHGSTGDRGIDARDRTSLTVINANIQGFTNSIDVSDADGNGPAGDLVVENSVVESLISEGYEGSGDGTQGGSIRVVESYVSNEVSTKGGSGNNPSVDNGGKAGDIYFEAKSLDVADITIDMTEGDGLFVLGNDPTLTFNYSWVLNDTNTSYVLTNSYLQMQKGSSFGSAALVTWDTPFSGFSASLGRSVFVSPDIIYINGSVINASGSVEIMNDFHSANNPVIFDYNTGEICANCTNSTELYGEEIVFSFPYAGFYSILDKSVRKFSEQRSFGYSRLESFMGFFGSDEVVLTLDIPASSNVAFASMNISGEALLNYTGDVLDTTLTENMHPLGVSFDGTYFWVSDNARSEMYKYYLNGTYAGVSFDINSSGNSDAAGVYSNGFFVWVVDNEDAEVYKYATNGNYVSSFDTNFSGNSEPIGITSDGIYLWITDMEDAEVYKYYMNGTYAGESFDTEESGNDLPLGIAYNGSRFFVSGVGGSIFVYSNSGVYIDENFDVSAQGVANPIAMTYDGGKLWIVDVWDKKIREFSESGVATGEFFVTHGDLGSHSISGVAYNGSDYWLLSSLNGDVLQYDGSGAIVNVFNVKEDGNGWPSGLALAQDYLWISNFADRRVYKYYLNGTYTGFNFSTNLIEEVRPRAITGDDNYLWVGDSVEGKVYKYYANGTYIGESFEVSSEIDGLEGFKLRSITKDDDYFWIVSGGGFVHKFGVNGSHTGDYYFLHNGYSPLYTSGLASYGDYLFSSALNKQGVRKYSKTGSYSANLWIEVGTVDESSEWSYSGEFSSKDSTNDFSNEVNVALNGGACDCEGCELNATTSICSVPLTLHSDSEGLLRLSNLEVTWE